MAIIKGFKCGGETTKVSVQMFYRPENTHKVEDTAKFKVTLSKFNFIGRGGGCSNTVALKAQLAWNRLLGT